jgi:hypothetical protein
MAERGYGVELRQRREGKDDVSINNQHTIGPWQSMSAAGDAHNDVGGDMVVAAADH